MAVDPYKLSGKEERQYRRDNPYSDYSKQKEMRFLNDIDKMRKGNQGVSDAQVSNYNRLKDKWNYQTPWEKTRQDVLQNPTNVNSYKAAQAQTPDSIDISKYQTAQANSPGSLNYNQFNAQQMKAPDQVDVNSYGATQAKEIAQVNPGQYKTELASIEDISRKYGFDYSREYAKKQSEMIAQQKRDAGKEGLKNVDNAVMSASDSLDRNYFQQFMNQAQGQTNSGVNAGIATDQNLRLAMSRQAAMGDVYRDANAQRFQLNNDLARVEQERIAMEDQMFNERLQQGFQNILAEGQFHQADNLAALQAAIQQRGQDVETSITNANNATNMTRAQLQAALDQRNQDIGVSQFNSQLARDYDLATLDAMLKERGQDIDLSTTNASLANNMTLAQLDAAMQQRGQNIDMNQFNTQQTNQNTLAQLDAALRQYDQFLDIEKLNQNWSIHKDNRKLNWAEFNEKARQFDNLSAYEDAKLGQDWSMHKDNRKLNWAQFNEGASQFDLNLQQQQREFNANLAQRQKEFMTEFNNLSAFQQEQVALDQARNQLARDQFNKEYSSLTAYEKAAINQQKDELAQRAYEFQAEMEFAAGYEGKKTGDDAYYDLDKSDFTQGAGNKHTSLGSLSSKYESSGNPGTIGRNAGDWGGASYGTYQIATNTGTMNSFLEYVNKNHKGYAFNLNQAKPGTSQFDKIWKDLASKDPKGFQEVQHGFIKHSHYDPAARRIKSGLGIDVNSLHPAVQDVLWSTAVQHGATGAYNVFKNAGVKKGMSPQAMINAVYNERSKVNQYFSKSSSSIKQSVKNRFAKERKDALAML